MGQETTFEIGDIVRYPRVNQSYEIDRMITGEVIGFVERADEDNILRMRIIAVGSYFVSVEVGSIKEYSAGLFEVIERKTIDDKELMDSLYRLEVKLLYEIQKG